MVDIETLRPAVRGVAVLALLVVLAGLFVLAGTGEPDPAANEFPGNDEVGQEPAAYVSDRVWISGTVVSQDPLRIEVAYGLDGTREFTVRQVEEPPPVGYRLEAFGRLAGADTLDAETTVIRAPWELTYTYVVSFIGGLWVLIRLLRRWRYDPVEQGVVPRGEHRG